MTKRGMIFKGRLGGRLVGGLVVRALMSREHLRRERIDDAFAGVGVRLEGLVLGRIMIRRMAFRY